MNNYKLEKINGRWQYDQRFVEWLKEHSCEYKYLSDIAKYLNMGDDSLRLIVNKNNLNLQYSSSNKNKDYNGQLYNKNKKGFYSQKEGFNNELIEWIKNNYLKYNSLERLAIGIGINIATLRKLIKNNNLNDMHNYFMKKALIPDDKLLGTYIGKLYINKQVDKLNNDTHRRYECICNCGNIGYYTTPMLKRRTQCDECISKELSYKKEQNKLLKKREDIEEYNNVRKDLIKNGYREIIENDGYFVSNIGNVIHIVKRGKHWGERQLKPFLSNSGYLYLGINNHKRGVHQLVALMFCEGYEQGLVVNHKDLNKQNNNYTNLEWMTHQENTNHYYKTTNTNSIQNYNYYELISPDNKKYGLFKGYQEVEDYITENNFDISTKSLRYYGYSKKWTLKFYDKDMNEVNKFYG